MAKSFQTIDVPYKLRRPGNIRKHCRGMCRRVPAGFRECLVTWSVDTNNRRCSGRWNAFPMSSHACPSPRLTLSYLARWVRYHQFFPTVVIRMSKTARRKSRPRRSQVHGERARAVPIAAPASPPAEIKRDIPAKEPLNRSTERSILPYIVSVLLVLPNFYWVLKDKTVWPWDQAWYGEVSVDLWYLLTHHLGQWPAAMLSAFGSKTPGVAWFGQFFVPLGQAVGSIWVGLLLSI